MKHIKRIGLFIIVLFISVMLVACSDKSNNDSGKEKLCVVAFKINDNVYDIKMVKSNSKVEKPADPFIIGEEFDSWYEGETEWNFETNVVTKNITLNAKFLDEEEYVKISTKKELIIYASNPENYKKNARLYADIDLGGMEWTPIAGKLEFDENGSPTNSYSAIFDGNGHTISNYKITKTTVNNIEDENIDMRLAGFFGYVEGTIKNLGLTDYEIEITESGTAFIVGGLIAFGENVNILNCYTTGDISLDLSMINNDGSCYYAGGLSGFIGEGIIQNCYVTGDIDVSTTTIISPNTDDSYTQVIQCVTGLGGVSSDMFIQNCYVSGDVTLKSKVVNESSDANGYFESSSLVTGIMSSNVLDSSYMSGDVNASIEYNGYIAPRIFVSGIFCDYSDNVKNSYFSGNVHADVKLNNTKLTEDEINELIDGINELMILYGGVILIDNYEENIVDFKCPNCYTSNESDISFKLKLNGKLIDIKKTENGTVSDMETILAFVVENFDSKVWNLFENKNPIIKIKLAISSFIEINSKEDLLKLQGKTFIFKGIKLNKDINLDGAEWEPIILFNSIFDGGNYKVSNFKITTERENNGFIAELNESTVKNLGVKNFVFKYESEISCDIGGLIGYSWYSTIENCYSTGDIEISTSSGYNDAGGLIGDSWHSTIKNCYATGNIEISSSSGSNYAGGLIGYSRYSTIKNCYATGDVTITSSSGGNYAGGLIGYSSSTIENCYATGNVTITSSLGDNYAGGLIGYDSSSTIENCYATGNVEILSTSGSSYYHNYAGGLIGYDSYSSTIENCYATGNVTITTSSDSNYFINYAGGLIGYDNYSSTIENCYVYNNQILTVSSYASYNEIGISADMQTIWNFVSENFDSEIWNLYSNKNPTLK